MLLYPPVATVDLSFNWSKSFIIDKFDPRKKIRFQAQDHVGQKSIDCLTKKWEMK
jgi:hypothetical protein